MNIDQIKAHNSQAGFYFFDANALRWFKSRISAEVHAGRYFVTSEQHSDDARLYTIREYDSATGSVSTAQGFEFQQFDTLAKAKRAMRKL